MINILKKIIILFIFLSFPFTTNAIFEQGIDTKYNSFYNKISNKYQNNLKILIYLKKIDKTIVNIKKTKQISFKNLGILNRLKYLNTGKINQLEGFKKVSDGIKIRNDLFLKKLKQNGFNYIPVNTNNFEFIKNNKINKVFFKKYNIINKDNFNYFIKNFNNGLIINGKDNLLYFLYDYYIEEKIDFINSEDKGFIYAVGKKSPIYKEEGKYKKINYSTFYDLKDEKFGFYKSDFPKLGKKIVIYNRNYNFSIIDNFNTSDILDENIIKDINNKEGFLDLIIDDEKKIKIKDKKLLLYKLKLITKSITKGKNSDEKIKIIYNYILNRLDYYKGNYNNNNEVFTGLLSYKNGYSVCDGYVKLFGYMLYFGGIEDFKIKKGYVINSIDFPEIGHAWIKIKGNYYDPTFDDPIGIKTNKTFNDYMYYNLPYNLMYASRFNGFNIPKKYLGKSNEYLNNIVNSNYEKLSNNYNGYNILNYYKIIKKLNLNINHITINDLLNNNLNYTVYENTYSYIGNDGKINKIKGLNYYTFKNNNELKSLIKQLGFNILNMKIFKWITINGNIEYRLGYNIKYK